MVEERDGVGECDVVEERDGVGECDVVEERDGVGECDVVEERDGVGKRGAGSGQSKRREAKERKGGEIHKVVAHILRYYILFSDTEYFFI